MKIRLYQDSIRFRMQISDVQDLVKNGSVHASLSMGSNPVDAFHYSVQLAEVASPEVRYKEGNISLYVPQVQGKHWAETDEVGIYADQKIGENGVLRILLEKDFKCLDNTMEDQSNMFPNPNSSCE